MSKQLQRLVETDPRFEELSDERAYGDGYWLYCAPGYWNAALETHFIHENRVVDVLACLDDIEPCSCRECAYKQGVDEEDAKLAAVAEGADADELLGYVADIWPTCPACGSQHAPILLGELGTLTWYRCRACGHLHNG